jgi:hypothetical protein
VQNFLDLFLIGHSFPPLVRWGPGVDM